MTAVDPDPDSIEVTSPLRFTLVDAPAPVDQSGTMDSFYWGLGAAVVVGLVLAGFWLARRRRSHPE
ncbi:hypothetical protein D5S17_26310 [Pseudonocardiaceae bacterium YIM PH 21723]|nr:hypothetical protein D5S17_26310 [Pseudonocardiaceae bacterium YIM PH 21723]